MYPNGLLSLSFSSGVMTLPIIPSYTKHYYAGSQRVASKIGTSENIGKFNCGWLIIPFGGGSAPINEKATAKEKLDTNTAASLSLLQAQGVTLPPNYGQNAGYSGFYCVSSYPGTEEKDAYWFHANHLGSSSFITGIDGEVNQNIEYFPSGEVFVENHLNSYNAPYKFNGKELDSETGYYYYGARYYNPRTSLWLNVDPLAEKYPSWSPYNYTLNNPIKYIDPDGRRPLDWYLKNGTMQMVYFQGSGERSGYTHMGSDPTVYSGSDTGRYPAAQLFKDSSFLFNGKAYSNGAYANVGSYTITSGVQSEASYWIDRISHLGNTGGDFYSNLGGAGVGQGSPFFRPGIDKVVDTEGYFGGMLNSLGRGNDYKDFVSFFSDMTSLTDMGSASLSKKEQDTFSFYGTRLTGVEAMQVDGRASGFRTTGGTYWDYDMSKQKHDSLINRVGSDNAKHLKTLQQKSDSLLHTMLKTKL